MQDFRELHSINLGAVAALLGHVFACKNGLIFTLYTKPVCPVAQNRKEGDT